MSYYVYSTSTNGHTIGGVSINGGHGLPNKHMWTPRGVATEITREQFEAIKNHRVFKALLDDGLMTVEKFKVEADKVAADMKGADKSAQKQSADFKGKDQKIKTN